MWHLGRFEQYAADYAGMVDVIITDVPYGQKHLPIYEALATFAHAVLAPGGWLLCLSGWQEHKDVLIAWDATPLEYITVCTYVMLGHGGQASRRTSTGARIWQQRAKALLWYQQPGGTWDRRRCGTTDLILVKAGESADRDPQVFNPTATLVEHGLLSQRFMSV